MPEIKKDLLSLQYSENFDIQGTHEEVVNLVLDKAQDVGTTIYGTVTDGTNPVPNATVKVFDSNGNPYMHTVTDEKGEYHFENLPVGTYSVAVSCSGYRLSSPKGVSLSAGSTVETDFVITADETLRLGAVYGLTVVTENQSKKPLGGVKLTLFNEKNEAVAATYSVADGEFAFYDLEDGNYFVLATAQGYLTTEAIAVNVRNGAFVNMTVVMTVDSRSFNGTVNGVITDKVGKIVTGCFVGLYEITKNEFGQTIETLVAVTKTNAQGAYLFGGLVAGNYIVKAKQNA